MSDAGLRAAWAAKARRDRNRQAGRCINDTNEPSHGPIVANSGGRCQHCHDVKRDGSTASMVECPQCFAAQFKPCRAMNGAGEFTKFHKARIDAARKEKAS